MTGRILPDRTEKTTLFLRRARNGFPDGRGRFRPRDSHPDRLESRDGFGVGSEQSKRCRGRWQFKGNSRNSTSVAHPGCGFEQPVHAKARREISGGASSVLPGLWIGFGVRRQDAALGPRHVEARKARSCPRSLKGTAGAASYGRYGFHGFEPRTVGSDPYNPGSIRSRMDLDGIGQPKSSPQRAPEGRGGGSMKVHYFGCFSVRLCGPLW
jgi:hypothetical protein